MSSEDKIYNKLLKTIVAHQLPPGARLPEDKLSEAFNVSRTGIRKVLQRLALEQFVLIRPNKGAEVYAPDQREANEVFDSRILIETQLIPNLIRNWDRKLSAQLRQIVLQEKQAEKDNDLPSSILLTSQFHYELAKIAGNTVLANFVENLCYRSSLVIASYGSINSVGCDCGDHGHLLDLLDNQDTEGAVVWMKHHLSQIKASLEIDRQRNSQIDFRELFAS
ncbi:GntR family transcriptional regulator [Vibrio sp. EA2]|uniref:GntR family transcriptional regulator n=1 Tax=Vibrio sp. EA2 TaxID=3079860 RepID=UPI002949D534|nr:GntR family transcriptional regulator [Vibrio sp. EA2]MDV6250538.1 GntR family transcriptional regulator [Vibrio sp. EA2]